MIKENNLAQPTTLAKYQWLLGDLTRYDTTAFCHNRCKLPQLWQNGTIVIIYGSERL